MEGFYVTDKGIELIRQAIKDGTKVDITKAKFGDGGDSAGERDYSISELKSEQYTKNFDPLTDSYEVSDTDGKALVIKTMLPAEVECTVNEIGYFDSSDNLVIYGIVREEEKRVGVPHQYINWVKFDNLDETSVEITVVSPEYEKVEQLVDRAEKDFDLSNYVKISDLQGVDLKELSGKVTELESKIGQVDLSELESRVGTIETDLDGFLEVLKETVK